MPQTSPPSPEDIDTQSRNDAEGGVARDDAPRDEISPDDLTDGLGIDTFSRNDAEGGVVLDEKARRG